MDLHFQTYMSFYNGKLKLFSNAVNKLLFIFYLCTVNKVFFLNDMKKVPSALNLSFISPWMYTEPLQRGLYLFKLLLKINLTFLQSSGSVKIGRNFPFFPHNHIKTIFTKINYQLHPHLHA